MRELGKWLPSFTAVKLLGSKDERADMVRDYLHSKARSRYTYIYVYIIYICIHSINILS